MDWVSPGGDTPPLRLLHLCKDLGLIDDYSVDADRVAIRQDSVVQRHSPAEAEAFLDMMLDMAPLLKRIASDCPRIYGNRVERP